MTTEPSNTPPRRALRGWFAAGLASVLFVHVAAQTPASPTFEVATVKPNKSGDSSIRLGFQPGGRFIASNVPLRELIRIAFNVQPFQIEGGPGWINSDRFDVTAKAQGELPPMAPGQMGPVQVMMQNLLIDRFALKVRRETKEMPIYALVLARSDGKLGPKLEPSTVDCAAMARGRGAGGGGQPPTFRPGERPECGMMVGPGSVAAGGVTMDLFAQSLSPRVQRMVVNKSGLTGSYGLNLDFTPEQMPQFTPPGAPPIDPNGPSLFTALQEQLGLKLDSQRGQVETLIIESVSQPTPD